MPKRNGEGFYWVRVTDECKHKCDHVCDGWTVGLDCDGHWSLIGSTKHFSDGDIETIGEILKYELCPKFKVL